jgi:DNA-binding SARP family transcriptional activator
MAALELKFLGDLAVLRGSIAAPLPPSRKTRALLAYLALNGRAFHREHLCELLWEIPDDPRGSLRWSLSKLRHLVDDEGRCRIIADRNTVRFDATDVAIDIVALHALAERALEDCPLDELERAARRYCGNPLEGLELPAFHGFHTWCIAERERAVRAQTRLLSFLTERLKSDPSRALPHAFTLVRIAPYDESARATLVRFLLALGRRSEAEQQYRSGLSLLKEAGVAPSGELERARRSEKAPFLTRIEASAALARPSPLSPSKGAASVVALNKLVGRDTEIKQIATALSQCMEERRTTLVLVSGEPGIGKSCLLEATGALARQCGALLLQACAYESEAIRPFALWIDALRGLDPHAARQAFGRADPSNREDLFSGLSDLVAERSRAQPVVLLFDDLQWSDESSAAALHYVVRTNRDKPVLGILAAREDELRDNRPVMRTMRELRQSGLLKEMRLAPLAPEAVRKLIEVRSPEVDSERLSRQCAGNPLLAIELARAEAVGDSAQSLDEVVRERLARLDIEGGEVLRWAAVLAPRIDASTLTRVTGLDWNRIVEDLEMAARQALLHQIEGGFRFTHDLIAHSIYAGIAPARRRTMHRRVAEVLEQDTVLDPEKAAELARHASQSCDAGLAARAMVSAGRLCLRFFANEQALSLAHKGLQWAEQLSSAERVCLTLDLREIILAAAPVEHWEETAKEYSALAEQALDHGALSHARRGYYMASYVRWMHGHWAGAREEILQAERVARGGNPEEHIIGMAEAARCLAMLERDLAHADAMLMEAQALAARRNFRHCAIPGALGMLRFHENELDEAEKLFMEARTLARSSGDRISEFQANEYLAMIDIERGRLSQARERCVSLIELGEKLREGSERPFACALDALCRYAMGEDGASLESALEELRAADAKHRLAYVLARAALTDVDRRRIALAMSHAREALSNAEALERPTERMLSHVALARACRVVNDETGYESHIAAIEELEQCTVAAWARAHAATLKAEQGAA